MPADAFDNFRLCGKQEFWLVSAGSHRFEVGSFLIVIKHGLEKGRDDFQHFRSCWRGVTINLRDVVEIDIDGQPCEAEKEEIEGRSALEGKLSPKISMLVEFAKELAKAENFFKIVGGKARVCGEFSD